jgi:hypothetical protein
VAAEDGVTTVDKAAEPARRQIGRPSKADASREGLVQALTQQRALKSIELLHCVRLAWYTDGKSAIDALVQTLRCRPSRR